MRFHFVEIGTCDYDTLLEGCRDDEIGISVEPIKEYLDRLPNRPNVTKVNAAVSSRDGLVDLYWVRPEHHDKPGLSCTKGWGSITKPHPGHTAIADQLIAESILTKESVQAITWATLTELCGISGVNFVKVDAEGHDCVVVESILDAQLGWLPDKIQFETTHVPPEDLGRTTARLLASGYQHVSQGEDAIFTLPQPRIETPSRRVLPVEYVERQRKYVLFKNDCGITDAIRRGGIYEHYVFEYIRTHLTVAGTTILDVGGNLGQHAMEFGDLVGPTGVVHSFEAQRLVYYQLCANILLNGFPNIFAHHLALGDKTGTAQMGLPDYFADSNINIGNALVDRFLTHSEPVNIDVLDRFGFQGVSVLKIDVEGYEPYVLDGARETILANRPTLFLEIWNANLSAYGFTEEDVFSRLRALGYRWEKLIPADHIIDYVAVPL